MTEPDPLAGEEQQRCAECGQTWPVSDFYSANFGRTVKSCGRCRAAKIVRNDRRHARLGVQGVREKNLKRNYGVTSLEYDTLRANQEYRCAICGDHEDDIAVPTSGRPRKDGQPPETAFKLVVDHCHNSKRVRGLLCNRCNAAIGMLRDSPVIIAAAGRYVVSTGEGVPHMPD